MNWLSLSLWGHQPPREQHPFCSPFLHLTVGVAAVVDEASLVAHAVAVDDHATVQVQAVMVTVVVVLLNHPVPVEQHRERPVTLLVPTQHTGSDTARAHLRQGFEGKAMIIFYIL